MRLRAVGVASALVLTLSQTAFAADLDVAGHWYTKDRSSIVAIEDCGNGTPCGTVEWLNREVSDDHNRDRRLRGRPLLGISLLSGFKRNDDGWKQGVIYNPEDGRTYRAHMQLISNDSLSVSGCLGPICKTLIWHRASESTELVGPATKERSEDLASL